MTDLTEQQEEAIAAMEAELDRMRSEYAILRARAKAEIRALEEAISVVRARSWGFLPDAPTRPAPEGPYKGMPMQMAVEKLLHDNRGTPLTSGAIRTKLLRGGFEVKNHKTLQAAVHGALSRATKKGIARREKKRPDGMYFFSLYEGE